MHIGSFEGQALKDWWINPIYFSNDIISLKTEKFIGKKLLKKLKS